MRNDFRRSRAALVIATLVVIPLLWAGCGSSSNKTADTTTTPSTSTPAAFYTVGGTVTGLSGTLVLSLNGGNNATMTGSGTFTFGTTLADRSAYTVAVVTQPSGQTCTVANGSGTIAGADVTDVAVACIGGLSFTNGDGVPEMTGVPSLAPTTIAAGATLTVSVPVDSDVGYAMACLYATFADALIVDRGCSGQSRTPAAGTATFSLTAAGVLPAGSGYWVLVFLCTTQANCNASTGTVYTSSAGSSTYSRQTWTANVAGTATNTGVAIPTFTSTGGGAAASGSLDTTFGTGGLVTYNSGNTAPANNAKDLGSGIVVDASGKILVTGQRTNGSDADMAIWRYTAAGVLDTTFNTTGYVVKNGTAGGAYDAGVAIALDGTDVVVAGAADGTGAGSSTDMALWRYTSTGGVVSTFNGAGYVVAHTPSSRTDINQGTMKLDGSGNILVTGDNRTGGTLTHDTLRLWCYTPTGAVCSGFATATGGVAGGIFANSDSQGNALALAADAKILVAGRIRGTNTGFDLAVWRFNTDGSLDTTYGGIGYVTYDGTARDDEGKAIAAVASNKILVLGDITNVDGNTTVALLRYNSDGTLDTSFGASGRASYFVAGIDVSGTALVVDSTGRILVTAIKQPTSSNDWDLLLLRFTAAGVLDASFGTGGVVTYAGSGGTLDAGLGMVLDASGKILVTGITGGTSIGTSNMAIWRFNP